jgi:hypothetical protein
MKKVRRKQAEKKMRLEYLQTQKDETCRNWLKRT